MDESKDLKNERSAADVISGENKPEKAVKSKKARYQFPSLQSIKEGETITLFGFLCVGTMVKDVDVPVPVAEVEDEALIKSLLDIKKVKKL